MSVKCKKTGSLLTNLQGKDKQVQIKKMNKYIIASVLKYKWLIYLRKQVKLLNEVEYLPIKKYLLQT